MRPLAHGLLALAFAILAALYWIAVAQIAFSLTGTDPFSLVSTGAFATAGSIAAIAVFIGGVVAYALASRAYFRFQRRRLAHG